MGMDAYLICFGPMTPKLRVMEKDYPFAYYEDVKDGEVFIETMFQMNTSDQSQVLALALGIKDAYAFATHRINKEVRPNFLEEIDMAALAELDDTDEKRQLEFILAAYEEGWTIFYRPNF